MLSASFSNHNELLSLDMSYDVMQVMQLLQGCQRQSLSMPITPNSIDMALSSPPAPEPRLVINCTAPHHIVNVNPAWQSLWGHTQSDTEGQTFGHMMSLGFDAGGAAGLRAEQATEAAIERAVVEVKSSRASECVVSIYDKGGEVVVAHLTCVPLPDKKVRGSGLSEERSDETFAHY